MDVENQNLDLSLGDVRRPSDRVAQPNTLQSRIQQINESFSKELTQTFNSQQTNNQDKSYPTSLDIARDYWTKKVKDTKINKKKFKKSGKMSRHNSTNNFNLKNKLNLVNNKDLGLEQSSHFKSNAAIENKD